VEAYERRFFELKKFSGWAENDKAMIQHFIRGLMPRIGEEVRTFRPTTMQEASERAKLIEMKTGYHVAAYKSSMNLSTPEVSKSQKPPQSSAKFGVSSGKFKKRKFGKNTKGSDQPNLSQPLPSVQSSKPTINLPVQNSESKKNVVCFHCGQLGHYQSQCPNWDKPRVGPRSARSEATVGDSARNHRIFATLDKKQAEH
jgi:hypothetical protein